jgi:hypothetical protein
MRIVTGKELLSLPDQIIYSQYASLGLIDGLYRKTVSRPTGWYYQDLIGEINTDDYRDPVDAYFAAEEKKELTLDFNSVRRETASDDELFLVYDKSDLTNLSRHLVNTLFNYPDNVR